MFGRLLGVRLKAAEAALRDGRLDEAFRLAMAGDIRGHRRGTVLLPELADKLVGRAREHLNEERFAEALVDLDKAEGCGLRAERVDELRRNIQRVADEVKRIDESRRRRIEDAKRRIAAGSLHGGRAVLAGGDVDVIEAKKLSEDIDAQERQAAAGFADVRRLLDDGQMTAAIERYRRVRRLWPTSAESVELERSLVSRVVADARSAFESGRIGRAAEELERLADVGAAQGERRDVEELIEAARQAGRALGHHDFETARRQVLRLRGLAVKVKWVAEVGEHLDRVDELVTGLHGGPLGELARRDNGAGGPRRAVRVEAVRSLDETVVLKDRASADELPSRLLLLVDGGGSYLLLRNDRVGIGRAVTAKPADIPLRSNLAERHAEIVRVEDDYFLYSGHGADIDGRPTKHDLLRNGSRVTLGPNARFVFRMPHRQSGSAVLEMRSDTKMPNDVRRVVLFRQTAMMGFGKHVHVSCGSAVHDLVLFERAGRLWIRPQANGRIDTEARAIEIGQPMELFNVSFVVQPWTAAGGALA